MEREVAWHAFVAIRPRGPRRGRGEAASGARAGKVALLVGTAVNTNSPAQVLDLSIGWHTTARGQRRATRRSRRLLLAVFRIVSRRVFVYVFREGGSTDPEINGRRPGRLRQHVHLIHDELESGAEHVEAPPGYILPRYRKSVAFMTDVSHTGPHTTSIARWPALGLGTPPIPRSTDRMQLKIVRRCVPFRCLALQWTYSH